jgi:type II secretory pathway pseudopilin PulG
MVPRANNQTAQARENVRAGFSMMDLLVSMAVIAVLLTILLPSLGAAMESARRVKCQSNLRQIGMGLSMFADDHSDQFPDTVHTKATTYNGVLYPRHEETIFLRLEETSTTLRQSDGWDGLGTLLNPDREAAYLSHSGVMYCPSHSGDHDRSVYADGWIASEAKIAGNYQYRLPIYATRRIELDPAMAIVSDGLREQSDYNHKVGNNLLKADLSVSWFNDETGQVYEELVADGNSADARVAVAEAWGHLDLDPKRPVSSPPAIHDDNHGIFATISLPGVR